MTSFDVIYLWLHCLCLSPLYLLVESAKNFRLRLAGWWKIFRHASNDFRDDRENLEDSDIFLEKLESKIFSTTVDTIAKHLWIFSEIVDTIFKEFHFSIHLKFLQTLKIYRT